MLRGMRGDAHRCEDLEKDESYANDAPELLPRLAREFAICDVIYETPFTLTHLS
jgi:hypothetical protein